MTPLRLIWLGLAITLAASILISCSHGKNPVDPGVTDTQGQVNSTDSTGLTSYQSWITGLNQLRGQTAPRWLPDEVLVQLWSQVSLGQAVAAFQTYPLTVKRIDRLPWGTMYRLKITDGTSVPDMVTRLKLDPRVKTVEPNYTYQYCDVPYLPNDPKFIKETDGTDPRVSVYDQWGPYFIGAPLVWNEEKGSSDVVVAVLDTGVRNTHEDLVNQIWSNVDEIPDNGIDDDLNGYVDDTWGWNCRDWSNNPYDDGSFASYHGTACAGVIAAEQDNFKGVSGVAPGVKIMPILADMFFSGTYTSDVIEGLEYARVNQATIVSMSFGGWDYSDLMEQQCLSTYNGGEGVILMAAAGNEDSTTCRYPGAFDCVITIGATCPFDGSENPMNEARIGSGTGFYWGSCYGDKLDVMGYGSYYETTLGEADDTYWEGGESGFGGTSCATPMSAGTMALIKSFFPDENAKWCWDRIKDTADDLDIPGFDTETGWGRCNAFRAIYGSDRY
jgi:subtilisin family serine protease